MRKTVISFILLTLGFCSAAQLSNWQHKDLKADSTFGVSTDRAYAELLKNKKPGKVLVAVIDSGIDTLHEDLSSVIWINPKEISGNGADDDHNGYVDDIHGWNFIGGPTGDVRYDNIELTRLMRQKKAFFDSLSYTSVSEKYQMPYQAFRKMSRDYDSQLADAQNGLAGVSIFKKELEEAMQKIGKDHPTMDDFISYRPDTDNQKKLREFMIGQLGKKTDFEEFKTQQVDMAYQHFKELIDYALNMDFDPRPIVGDNYMVSTEKNYGNNNVLGPHADHGTHVAGIIGAKRGNNIGIDGMADNVQIMGVRVVPQGDERDKDVANAIRYAVDNGAKIINMSFGKPYSFDKKVVDEAVKYAMSKDVLIIHAAGNDGKNLDEIDQFPNRYFADGSGQADAWIEVGASGWKDDSTLVAPFSNYSRTKVDVFAPGVQVYSTTPGSKYAFFNGTSMAAPMVSGLAALIWEYYPKLKAVEVKNIILRSVVKVEHPVLLTKDHAGQQKIMHLSEICLSGGIINAYNALKLAANY